MSSSSREPSTYLEVSPHSRLAWTNDEGEGDPPVTTVTFEEREGKTLQVKHDLFASKEVLEAEIAFGATSGTDETFAQLDELLVTLARSASSAYSQIFASFV